MLVEVRWRSGRGRETKKVQESESVGGCKADKWRKKEMEAVMAVVVKGERRGKACRAAEKGKKRKVKGKRVHREE